MPFSSLIYKTGPSSGKTGNWRGSSRKGKRGSVRKSSKRK